MTYLEVVKENLGENWIENIQLNVVNTTVMVEKFNDMIENDPTQEEAEAYKAFTNKLDELGADKLFSGYPDWDKAQLTMMDHVLTWERKSWKVSR